MKNIVASSKVRLGNRELTRIDKENTIAKKGIKFRVLIMYFVAISYALFVILFKFPLITTSSLFSSSSSSSQNQVLLKSLMNDTTLQYQNKEISVVGSINWMESTKSISISSNQHTKTILKKELKSTLNYFVNGIKKYAITVFKPIQFIYRITIIPLWEKITNWTQSISNSTKETNSEIKSVKVIFPTSYTRHESPHKLFEADHKWTTKQQEIIMKSYQSELLQDKTIRMLAKETQFDLSPRSVFQYHEATDWIGNYHGMSIEQAIRNTIEWRKSSQVHKIELPLNDPLLRKGFIYVSPVTDKKARSIIYVKLGQFVKNETLETYSRMVMHSVERADRIGIQTGSNHFIAIMDLDQFTFNKCPPQIWGIVKHLISLQKYNYPHRLNAIIVVNAGPAFSILWNILKPLLPKKAISKVHVLDRKSTPRMLNEMLGLEYVLEKYGGKQPSPDFEDQDTRKSYILSGYWG